jgi:hypothetical protein
MNETTPAYPFLDPDLSLDQRVEDLVSRLTLGEKALGIGIVWVCRCV